MTPTEVLSQYAHRLKIAAPKEFDSFVECFDAYATEVTLAVTSAEQHEVLNRQGRAQFALTHLRMLRECHLPPKKPPSPQP